MRIGGARRGLPPGPCALEHSFEPGAPSLVYRALRAKGKAVGFAMTLVDGAFRIAAKNAAGPSQPGLRGRWRRASFQRGSMRCNFASMFGLQCELSAF